MKTLSASAERICVLAIEHFAERGYDGSSLNDIATLANMRKPSLYAHFSSKDDLYLIVFERALENERLYMESGFSPDSELNAIPGREHVEQLAERHRTSASLRFLLRAAFYPPTALRPVISAGFEGYLAVLRERFARLLVQRHPHMGEADLQLFADAYQGIVDSLHVELIYATPQAYDRRLKALWRLFCDSLSLSLR
ncbi:TetR/AcrR family transcriptional regulator [Pseudomonas syringae]|nr:TetR/AcrR family transcriptional regulator [Pseudomonas syringae]MBD8576938.1 TetR/AcrR family transcriptional regulator [Pseudomonas syringae]MBD8792029.1 TetR/AcrR family transcriptional regulator [Pseudomonas syringae]MBD8801253.1 TetR/AcrR family transcriptional regulator [Pseudomonas syringae]MBD8813494.1 TetR/AcrR family transcriptional regulator [Pseudomonas syringae]